MGKVVEFKKKTEKQKAHLYIVDDRHVMLAHSPEDAVAMTQLLECDSTNFSVSQVDDDRVLNVIHSGKVQIILWDREPRMLERLAWTMTVREFIDKDLKKQPIPSRQDYVEDRGVAAPKS